MHAKTIIAAFILVGLSGCGGNKEDSQLTETRMDDLDSLEGTISDDMVNTDTSTDEGPIEAAPPAEAKPTAKTDDNSTDKTAEPAAASTEDKAATE
ncbi:hypothetical protein [Sphingorhabdus contaminans]|jgi:hypothetical protein|uniref:Uncharacterized protein n=1 Tax=Sphingorhabdus contaminans TaxID=1343899 RepID=A0A553WHI5_9SPHN|nr:hypothetical protein [Sphingorhabdus contaminans]TSB04159.1 hypothetical protein FOM92_01605 [Sphingorhabdus contaminans]